MRYNDKIRERVIAAYRENPNSAAITKRFGVSHPTIMHWVRKDKLAQSNMSIKGSTITYPVDTERQQLQALSELTALRYELNQAYAYIGKLRVQSLAQTSSPQKS